MIRTCTQIHRFTDLDVLTVCSCFSRTKTQFMCHSNQDEYPSCHHLKQATFIASNSCRRSLEGGTRVSCSQQQCLQLPEGIYGKVTLGSRGQSVARD